MFRHYRMTILEELLENTYATAGIIYPHQITVEKLSCLLNVWLHYAPVCSRALEAVSGMYSMFLDNRIPPDQQRLDFLHELCHLLRHAGNQMTLPESFTRMQEIEAEQFVMYAAMPISMISKLTIPSELNLAIALFVETFNVPSTLAKQRIEQIDRRINQGMMSATIRSPKHEVPCWSSETERLLDQLDRQLIAKGFPGM